MTLNCCTCGKFMTCEPGASWKMVYNGYPPVPDREMYQCKTCTERHGTLPTQHGIKPEASSGVFREQQSS